MNRMLLTTTILLLAAKSIMAQPVSMAWEVKSKSIVLCTNFSPDDTTLAVGHRDGRIELWDVASRSVVAKSKSEHPEFGIRDLAFNNDGTLLAAIDSDQSITFLDRSLKTDSFRLVQPRASCIQFGKDGKSILVASSNGLNLFDLKNASKIMTIKNELNTRAMAWSPDGKLIACGGFPDVIHVYDVATQAEVFRLDRHHKYFPYVAFGPDSKTLAIGGYGEVLFTNLENPKDQKKIPHLKGVSEIGYSPNGKLFTAIDFDSTTVMDLTSETVIAKIPDRQDSNYHARVSMSYSRNGKYLVLADAKGFTMWNLP